MAEHPNVARVQDLAVRIATQNARMRDVVARAVEALSLPSPDTFLGRRTYEPFPKELDE
ncbi:hypothetical protein [Bradyrhizobium sp. SEMIA]|uniref:hypothetical protein n=1 Tax=Bradyrhizobium sp. SEMIA TaxID=2597515 RepID=UPI002240AE81|nr:hypothetical protein [Bradyrhizobium sp. SEMIA]